MFKKVSPLNLSRRLKPLKTEVFETYWRFAAERQEVFFARLNDLSQPWTDDPIIREFKFTNAYRASDRVSQYLIKNVIYSKKWSLKDTVFRILLFKLFNKIETWELLEQKFGEVRLTTFSVDQYDQILDKTISSGISIYSAAYIMASGSKKKYGSIRKHRFHLMLLDSLLKSNFPRKLEKQNSLESIYAELLKIESLGSFLAYQFATDLNYSTYFDYSENDFVVPGPGAKDGIKKCFSDLRDYSEEDVIKMMTEEQELYFNKLGIKFRSLWGRSLHLIDCQNLFCEVGKYARVAHPNIKGVSERVRIKQKYKPKSKSLFHEPEFVWYPPKWDINDLIHQTPNYLVAL